MKVVFNHFEILPVKKYGGIERIIYWHMKQLVQLGHDVTLIGHPLSQVNTIGVHLIKCQDRSNWQRFIPNSTDIIHLFYNSKPIHDFPLIISMECNGQVGEEFHKNSVFVSNQHAKNHNSSTFVYNGIDLDEYPFIPVKKKWNQFCFLAKASWSVKNLKQTIAACQKSKKYLNVMGGRTWIPRKYIISHGMVAIDQKLQILRASDALIFPVRWHEPFGIAIIEAMSQGLPVIGSSFGSLPELINEQTGIICKDYQDLLNALSSQQIDGHSFVPQIIRNYVEARFSIKNFSTTYIKLYLKVINGEFLNSNKPSWSGTSSPESLLAF